MKTSHRKHKQLQPYIIILCSRQPDRQTMSLGYNTDDTVSFAEKLKLPAWRSFHSSDQLLGTYCRLCLERSLHSMNRDSATRFLEHVGTQYYVSLLHHITMHYWRVHWFERKNSMDDNNIDLVVYEQRLPKKNGATSRLEPVVVFGL